MENGKTYEFDEIASLSAVAVGEPGKRTFFIVVGQINEWVRVWLEKQELQALALAIRRLLVTISQDNPLSRQEAQVTQSSDDVPSTLPSAELDVRGVTLSYDGEKVTLDISVQVLGPQRLDHAELHCRTTITQLRRFGYRAESVCAAGRPICPLCGGPIDQEGHVCPRNN